MPVITEADLTMCADCAQIHANGIDVNSDADRAHVLLMFDTTSTWTGTIVVGEHTSDFSATRCDTCDTTLAGHRYSGALLGER